jgi:multidrug efflux system outer membrane protein
VNCQSVEHQPLGSDHAARIHIEKLDAAFVNRLDIAEKNIQTQEDTVHLTQARAAAGLVTQLDVSRAVAELETTKAVVPSLRSAISASIHRISVLVGQQPGALQRELEASAPVPVVPPEVPVGLPSDLLKRRPDVRRADDEIAAAAANVKAARADYFPRFTLFVSAVKASDSTP